MKRLTVGVCNYNNTGFLLELLDELNEQISNKNLPIHVAVFGYDDCSNNIDSLNILKEFELNFEVIYASKNSHSPCKGRYFIIDNCESEYVLLIDGDDVFPGDLEILLYELNNNDADIFVSNMQKVLSDGKMSDYTMSYSKWLFNPNVKKKDIHKIIVHLTGICSIYSVGFLRKNNLRYKVRMLYEDNYLFYNILCLNPKIKLLRHQYYGWRNNFNSFTFNVGSIQACANMAKFILKLLSERKENIYTPYLYYSMWNETITNIIRGYPNLSEEKISRLVNQAYHSSNGIYGARKIKKSLEKLFNISLSRRRFEIL